MKHIKIYKPPDGPAQAAEFIEGLEPRLRDKVVRQILSSQFCENMPWMCNLWSCVAFYVSARF